MLLIRMYITIFVFLQQKFYKCVLTNIEPVYYYTT